MVIMYKWLYNWLEPSHYVQIFEDIFSNKFNLIVKFLYHYITGYNFFKI